MAINHVIDTFNIRPYISKDESSVYDICLKSGDNGKDASHLYSDPLALGNIYAGPYIHLEPESAFVLEDSINVCGYILSAKDTLNFYDEYVHQWLPPLQSKYSEPIGNPSRFSQDEKVYYQYHHPDIFLIKKIKHYPAHLHIDLLPRAQRKGNGKSLMNTLMNHLRNNNISGVHLGVGATNSGAIEFYKKMGFIEFEKHYGTIYMGKKL